MERKLIKNKIVKINFKNDIDNNLIFSKLPVDAFNYNLDYKEELIGNLRFANSISVFLASDDLPQDIFEEFKWLKYYGFETKIKVNNESLKTFSRPIAKTIDVLSGIVQNRIEVTLDQNKVSVYLIDSQVKKLLALETLLDKNFDNNKFIYMYRKDCSKYLIKEKSVNFTSLEIITGHGDYHEWSNQEKLSKVAFINNLDKKITELVYYEGLIYKLVDIDGNVYLESYHLNTTEIFVNLIVTDDTYVYEDEKFILRQDESNNIKIIERKLDYNDYENEVIYGDMDKQSMNYPEYKNLNFEIFLEPPYIEQHSNFRLDKRYLLLKTKIAEFKKAVSSVHEISNYSNFDGDLDEVLKNIKKFIYTKKDVKEELTLLVAIINKIEDLSKFKKLLKDYYLEKEVVKSSRMDSSITKIESEIKTLEEQLIIAQSDVTINKINEKLINLNSILQNIKSKAGSDIDCELIFDNYINKSTTSNGIQPKSLNRIVKIGNSKPETTTQYHLLSRLLQVLQIARLFLDFFEEINFYEIPNVGLIYENEIEKALVIQYEDEFLEAKKIASKENLRIFISKGDK